MPTTPHLGGEGLRGRTVWTGSAYTGSREMLKRRYIFASPFPIPYRSHLEKLSRQPLWAQSEETRAGQASEVRTTQEAKGGAAWPRGAGPGIETDDRELLTNN